MCVRSLSLPHTCTHTHTHTLTHAHSLPYTHTHTHTYTHTTYHYHAVSTYSSFSWHMHFLLSWIQSLLPPWPPVHPNVSVPGVISTTGLQRGHGVSPCPTPQLTQVHCQGAHCMSTVTPRMHPVHAVIMIAVTNPNTKSKSNVSSCIVTQYGKQFPTQVTVD
jgi:hypothetical protein